MELVPPRSSRLPPEVVIPLVVVLAVAGAVALVDAQLLDIVLGLSLLSENIRG